MSRVVTPALLHDWPLSTPDGDKHSRGTVLVVGGAAATVGAVLLAGHAALRSGAGVLQLCCAPAVATTLAVTMPEALVISWDDLGARLEGADAVLVGPGLEDIDHALELLRAVVAGAPEADLVVDAYALGALSHEPALLHGRKRWPVLTPNATEAAVLGGTDEVGDLEAAAADLARRYQAVVGVRGHIATPEGEQWREEGGDVGLGTAGSGDVLAGLVVGLLARGAQPAQAACWAAHVHAAAGQRLAARLGRTGFLARELAADAPLVLASLQT
jgi:ADP-dependent NAD(P)H-hydrate dehydratase